MSILQYHNQIQRDPFSSHFLQLFHLKNIILYKTITKSLRITQPEKPFFIWPSQASLRNHSHHQRPPSSTFVQTQVHMGQSHKTKKILFFHFKGWRGLFTLTILKLKSWNSLQRRSGEDAFVSVLETFPYPPTRENALLIRNSLRPWQKTIFSSIGSRPEFISYETIFYNVTMKSVLKMWSVLKI